MSFGGYEARVGAPKLLELLRNLGLKATFFITGWSVEAHPAMAEAILRDGHEIGHHGFHHCCRIRATRTLKRSWTAGSRC